VKTIAIYLVSALFVTAGVLHFVRPAFFTRIVPPALPSPLALVYISGVAEILGGLGVLLPSVRLWAGYGLIALLIAVLPANVYMASAADRVGMGIAPAWLWLRIPLQFVLIALVWWATRTD
jgi:uncharacterized membrane protein